MDDLSIDVLVNKENMLSIDYIPKNMYIVDNNENNFRNYLIDNIKPMLRIEVKPYIEKLIYDANNNGINIIVDSAFRSGNYQQMILDKVISEKGNEAYKLVALPGTSEHQTGLAVDFAIYENGIYNDDIKEDDKEAIWLKDNAWKYGFILRYPKGKEDITGFNFEPWHYRFVGLELAFELYQTNQTLEEYKKCVKSL
ncbi:carboxypeptidase [Clostridium sp. CAG:609]|jgi:serine-type D-Ala-D-Ala carboxypeptidase|nr:carboxypeptidase [Clostridium sp. CAG:609]